MLRMPGGGSGLPSPLIPFAAAQPDRLTRMSLKVGIAFDGCDDALLQPCVHWHRKGSTSDYVHSRTHSLTAQVFNCTPDQLLPSVRAELAGLVQVGTAALLLQFGVGGTEMTPVSTQPTCHLACELQVGQVLLEGYIRPGCTQLTLNALVPAARENEVNAGVLQFEASLQSICTHCTGHIADCTIVCMTSH